MLVAGSVRTKTPPTNLNSEASKEPEVFEPLVTCMNSFAAAVDTFITPTALTEHETV
jgi:hypothetical protein